MIELILDAALGQIEESERVTRWVEETFTDFRRAMAAVGVNFKDTPEEIKISIESNFVMVAKGINCLQLSATNMNPWVGYHKDNDALRGNFTQQMAMLLKGLGKAQLEILRANFVAKKIASLGS